MPSVHRTPTASNYSASPVTVRNWPETGDDLDERDYKAYMAASDALGRLADQDEVSAFLAADTDHEAWLDAIDRGHYLDEPPTDEMFDDGPIFSPTQEDLDWLIGQLAAVADHPETVAELDRQIASMRQAIGMGSDRLDRAVLARMNDEDEADGYGRDAAGAFVEGMGD